MTWTFFESMNAASVLVLCIGLILSAIACWKWSAVTRSRWLRVAALLAAAVVVSVSLPTLFDYLVRFVPALATAPAMTFMAYLYQAYTFAIMLMVAFNLCFAIGVFRQGRSSGSSATALPAEE